MNRRVTAWLGSFSLLIAACGGDSDLGFVPEDLADAGAVENSGQTPQSPSSGAGETGPVTLEADPGQAWAEVDGQRIDYVIPGGLHYACEIGADQVRINFQNNAGNNLTVGGGLSADGWLLNLGFSAADGGNVGYSAVLPRSGTLGLDENGLSYEGPVERVEDFDVANATVVDAKVAINCLSPGGDPTAIVGGTENVFPFSGAQSLTCDVTDDAFSVTINRLGLDGAQLMMSAQHDGTNWNGSANVRTPDGSFSASFRPDVEGQPVVDGATVSYEGTFGSDSGDVEGSITVTCP